MQITEKENAKGNDRIKLAIIISDLKVEGAQQVVTTLCTHMDVRKYDICVVSLDKNKNTKCSRLLEQAGIKCLYFHSNLKIKKIRGVHRVLWLFRILDEFKPQLIHVHLDWTFAWIYSIFRRKRMITTMHSQPYRLGTTQRKWLVRYLDKHSLIKITILSEQNASEFAKIFQIPKSKLIIIPNPVDIKAYRYIDRAYEVKDGIKFLSVARFHPIKNHYLLLEAFAEVLKVVLDAELWLVGSGRLFDEEVEHAKRLGIDNKVRFLGEVDDIPAILKKVDVFVISSDSEAFPMSLIEAMASGLPIVTTAVGGINNIMNENGILVPPKDVLSLADAMVQIAQDTVMREGMGKQSMELVKKYDVYNVISQYDELYQSEYNKLGKNE